MILLWVFPGATNFAACSLMLLGPMICGFFSFIASSGTSPEARLFLLLSLGRDRFENRA